MDFLFKKSRQMPCRSAHGELKVQLLKKINPPSSPQNHHLHLTESLVSFTYCRKSWAVGFVWKCWVNIPNEIAIFHRDNDQQNHWVQWGFPYIFRQTQLTIYLSTGILDGSGTLKKVLKMPFDDRRPLDRSSPTTCLLRVVPSNLRVSWAIAAMPN